MLCHMKNTFRHRYRILDYTSGKMLATASLIINISIILLHFLVKGSCDYFLFLLLAEGIESNGITGDSNSQIWVFLRMFLCI